MSRYLEHYLDARLSIADFGWSRLPRLRNLSPLAGFRAWQESQRALSDLERLDPRFRADIGLAPGGFHPLAEDLGPDSAETGGEPKIAANDNAVPVAA